MSHRRQREGVGSYVEHHLKFIAECDHIWVTHMRTYLTAHCTCELILQYVL